MWGQQKDFISDIVFFQHQGGMRLKVRRHFYSALQRHNTDNSKQIFPEKKLCYQSQILHSYMFLWAIYIFPQSVCLFCCRKIGGPILEIYAVDRSQTHECRNWDWGRAIPFLGIHKSKFLCSAGSLHDVEYSRYSVSMIYRQSSTENWYMYTVFPSSMLTLHVVEGEEDTQIISHY